MAVMVLFPMYFLKSFAYAGVATVAFVAVAAIVVTPAAIVLLGPRLDALDVRRLGRRMLGRPDPVRKPVEQLFWYRSTKFVMRRAVPIGLAVVALLLVLGLPFLGVKWGMPDDRVLPTSASAHAVGDQLRRDFADDSATAVPVVVPDVRGVRPGDLSRYAADLSRVADVSAVSAPTGTFVGGNQVGPPSAATGMADGSAFLTVATTAPLFSQASDTQLDRLHAVPGPAGRSVQMAGMAQINRDSVRRDHGAAAAGAGAHRRHHLRAAVPAHRQCGAAVKGVGVQRFIADGGVRRAGVDLPGRPPRRAGHHAERHVGGQHPGAVVLRRVRPVDGLRGVPGLQDSRVLVGVRAPARHADDERPAPTTTRAWRSGWRAPAGWSPPPRW